MSMSKGPPFKRRKVTPPRAHEERPSLSKADAPAVNSFYVQASSWNLEQDYESRPRKGKKNEKESTRLPIKTADGAVQQVEAPEVEEAGSDLEWLNETEAPSEVDEEEEQASEKPKVPLKQQILQAKEELARIAMLLNEDPEEHVGAFKTLAQIGQTKNMTIKKLALATQLAVYKDVIPGYRIRPLNDEDMETKVSKEVRRLRAYEQALVGGYQNYIKELSKLAQSGKGGKGGKSRNGTTSLGSTAIACACALLSAVPHFNFRGELLKILVGKMSARNVDEDFLRCRDAIEKLFKEDEDGTPSLDAVSLLTKMIKQRSYLVHDIVLNTFLHLRLLTEFSFKASQNRIDRPEKPTPNTINGKKLKEKREFRTKKYRKQLKEQKAIDKEMVQADATVSHEERDRMQAETLKLVFVTYFRILKLGTPNLMGAVLEGLARYAHLINQDFFGDLLEALKDLIGHATNGDAPPPLDDMDSDADNDADPAFDLALERNETREALLCTITAFALLEGQDAARAASSLALDLSFFITNLYRHLYGLSLDPDLERSAKSLHLTDPNGQESSPSLAAATAAKVNNATTTVLLLRSLSSILIPKLGARAVPPVRVAAFTKQIATSALHVPERSCTAMMGLLGRVVAVQGRRIGALWNTEERRGDGRFDGLGPEVEGSNPFAGTVWEGELLRLHFSPAVREGIFKVEQGIVAARGDK